MKIDELTNELDSICGKLGDALGEADGLRESLINGEWSEENALAAKHAALVAAVTEIREMAAQQLYTVLQMDARLVDIREKATKALAAAQEEA